jgi:hypothetical protein
MASETLMKCAHPPCRCLVEAEQKHTIRGSIGTSTKQRFLDAPDT